MERFGPTRRGGPVFRWLGEPLAIDLANTVMVVRDDHAVDLLAAPEQLRRWLAAEQPRLGNCTFAVGHSAEIRALRDAVRRLLAAAVRGTTAPSEALAFVNAASAQAPVAPQLVAVAGARPKMVELTADGERLDQLLAKLARSAIALLTGSDRDRLHICEAPSCGMFFLGGRRWCCGACGNRARAARAYRRRKEGAAPSAR